MTLPNDLPPELRHNGVRAADRLGFTLFVAALIHLAIILGVSFSMSEPKKIGRTLEFTLSTFKSDKAPEKADFLAKDNQQGSGTLDKKAVPKTTEIAAFQENTVNKITPPPAAKPEQVKVAPKAAVTTVAPSAKKAPSKPQKVKTEAVPKASTPTFDRSQLSNEISSLEAELANDQQLYAKRPKIYRMSAASTMRDKGAWYKEDWRKKIERIGNLNYPEQARREKIYGKLRLLVSINRDGSLHEVLVLESSGHPVLDEAAQRIVRLTAPFAPFTGDMAEFDRLEIIRTWTFGRGDRLSSH